MSNPADGGEAGVTDAEAMTYVMTINNQGDADTYRKIVDRVSHHADGLIARYAGMNDNGLAVTTVWESKAHSDRFAAEQLLPAVRDIVGEPNGNATVIDFEAFDVDLRSTS
jgi:hypothetical protein